MLEPEIQQAELTRAQRASLPHARGTVVVQLTCDGVAVADVHLADTSWKRMKGLLGRSSLDGALWFDRCSSVHTLGMKFAIDVAFLDDESVVIDVVAMAPQRLGKPRRNAKSVVEAAAGSFADWNVKPGSKLAMQ